MRKPRDFKLDKCYHLTNRIANSAFYLNSEECARFVDRMWRVAGFSGVTVLAYCIMTNHFHLLIYLPEPVELSDDELMARIRTLYFGERLAEIEKEWNQLAALPSAKEKFRQRYFRRMGNLSEFMKTLKQHTSVSFNSRTAHTGTLWEAPFRPVAFDPSDKEALMSAAAYIDRNPVKAKIVTWPDAYEWCSFAAADRGDKRCIDGYRFIYSYLDTSDWKEIRETHGQVVARKLRDLEVESADGSSKFDAFVSGEKRGEPLLRGSARAEAPGTVPRLVERGSNKVALKILMLLRQGPLGPAELRQALALANADFFSSHYLTPMEASGLIEITGGYKRTSRLKKFCLTAKGSAIVAALA